MYEKPQYMTGNGFKRLDKNPHKDNTTTYKLIPPKPVLPVRVQRAQKGIHLTDEAAKAIAMAIKGMLK
jgi:hypothetical protein